MWLLAWPWPCGREKDTRRWHRPVFVCGWVECVHERGTFWFGKTGHTGATRERTRFLFPLAASCVRWLRSFAGPSYAEKNRKQHVFMMKKQHINFFLVLWFMNRRRHLTALLFSILALSITRSSLFIPLPPRPSHFPPTLTYTSYTTSSTLLLLTL